MIIGERIAALMKAQGISQAELARRVGVTQPTIFSLIHNNKTGSVHLHKVARALKTSPAYLTGESDDPSIDAVSLAISQSDVDWLDLIHMLSPRDRNTVRVLAQTLAATGSGSFDRDEFASVPSLQSRRAEFRGS